MPRLKSANYYFRRIYKAMKGRLVMVKDYNDIVGTQIRKWIVVSYLGKRQCHPYYECQCTCEAKTIRHKRRTNLLSETGTTGCIQCGGTNSGHRWKKGESPVPKKFIGDLSGTYFGIMKVGAVARGLEFTISQQYAWQLFVDQNKCCAYTGLPLLMPIHTGNGIYTKKRRSGNASLDRIDSSIGYIEGNLQWVHMDINRAKSVFSHERFIEMCQQVADHSATLTRSSDADVKVSESSANSHSC